MDAQIENLIAGVKAKHAAPQPGGWYSPGGDSVLCYLESTDYHADRVDRMLTAYRAEADGRLTGVQIKHIRRLPPIK
jgi:hypothetical protein